MGQLLMDTISFGTELGRERSRLETGSVIPDTVRCSSVWNEVARYGSLGFGSDRRDRF